MFAIAGVTGHTGAAAADTLLARGQKVRVIVRDAAKGEAWKKKGAEVALADLGDEKALTAALTGAKGVYLLSPPNFAAQDFLGDRKALQQKMVNAVRAAKIPSVVFLSSVGAQQPSGTGPIVTVHGAEALFKGAAPSVTFVRAAYFLENWGSVIGLAKAQGILPHYGPIDVKFSQVSSGDIGVAVADALMTPADGTKVVELAGKEDWEVTQMLANALGYPMNYAHPSEIMDEIARLTPTFKGVSFAKLDELGSIQWPCNETVPVGTPVMHSSGFVRGRGRFMITAYVPTEERTGPRFPLLLTTGRILSQYNVGVQTRRTENVVWHREDVLEIHPHDAEQRGISEGDWVRLASREGETSLRAHVTDRVAPGVVYTTFHVPDTQANVVTTEYSDWATNCPEYKVTAVQVSLSNGQSAWQRAHDDVVRTHARLERVPGE
jgi:uncharacterized protein YbjT (DUF2867 family)/formylmethanofuran dehydrogenase subunit D